MDDVVGVVVLVFATMAPDGHMLKRRNGRLGPYNVEIPLCAVMPDVFAQVEDALDAAHEDKLRDARRERARLNAVEALSATGRFLARPAGVALRVAADVFLDWVGRPFDQRLGRTWGWG